MRASHEAPWNLIVAIGAELSRITVDPAVYSNVGIFQIVPQLRVLREADLMITHGGANSLTECVLAGVPMLVYPGTYQIDQAGNAARVAYHGLGRMGRLSRASRGDIAEAISTVLAEPEFRRRVLDMRTQLLGRPSWHRGAQIVAAALFPRTADLAVAAPA